MIKLTLFFTSLIFVATPSNAQQRIGILEASSLTSASFTIFTLYEVTFSGSTYDQRRDFDTAIMNLKNARRYIMAREFLDVDEALETVDEEFLVSIENARAQNVFLKNEVEVINLIVSESLAVIDLLGQKIH